MEKLSTRSRKAMLEKVTKVVLLLLLLLQLYSMQLTFINSKQKKKKLESSKMKDEKFVMSKTNQLTN
jgi:hypothetical protein